jgi:hypothetical protein
MMVLAEGVIAIPEWSDNGFSFDKEVIKRSSV